MFLRLARQQFLCALLITPVALAAEKSPEIHGPVEVLAERFIRDHRYLLAPQDQARIDELNRELREARQREQGAKDDAARSEAARALGEKAGALIEMFERVTTAIRVEVRDGRIEPGTGAALTFPGDAGAVLLRISNGGGPIRCSVYDHDMVQGGHSDTAVIPVDVQAGTHWALIAVTRAPVRRTTLLVHVRAGGKEMPLPVDIRVPEFGRVRVSFTAEDTGKPTPVMFRLVWKTNGGERQPPNGIDFAPQFDGQGHATGRRPMIVPGFDKDHFWCVPGPVDMLVPPGEYDLKILHGLEYLPSLHKLTVKSGETTEKHCTLRRWVDMRKHGWYSGDDHVHCRIVGDADAERLMAWVKAEDIHVANVVKMGDINRTWFEQRGWGKAYRVISEDIVLSPGQECPRTHEQIGHTLAMNTTDMVRDTDRYFIYEEVADKVHAQGGLWGYAHVLSGMFNVHRDMSINVPKGKCDFVELMQFAFLGTELYYDFLNLGFKVTASAGSDVPWGGSVGEVRLYAYTGDTPFTADAWFEAVRQGRTFVTNGPMIEFRIDDALPGDELRVTGNRKIRIKAHTWGHFDRTVPVKLDIIRNGDVLRTFERAAEDRQEILAEFEVDAEYGGWIAAKVESSTGALAHTTPVYVVREGFRSWKLEAVDALVAKRVSSLDEVDKIVADAKRQNEDGSAAGKRDIQQLAAQGDELLKRVAGARAIYNELREVAERERKLRAERP